MDPQLSGPEQPNPALRPFIRRLSAGAVMVTATAALLCSGEVAAKDSPETTEPSIATAPSSCPPPPDTPEGWTDLTKNIDGWWAGDGISSVRLPSGVIIISGGDHIDSTPRGRAPFKSNALLSVCGEKAKSIVKDGEIIPSVDGQWYWPGEMVVNEEKGKLYVFANRVAKTKEAPMQGSTDFPFQVVGTDIAVFSLPDSADDDPQFLDIMVKTPASDNPEVDPDGMRRAMQWGASVVKGPDGYLYVYGSLMESRAYNTARDAYVARVPLEQLESPEAWEYFTGGDWSRDEWAASPVIDSKQQPGLDANWTTSYSNGRYTIASKRDGIFGTELGEWSSDDPTGPFTYRKLADLPPYSPEATTYNAHIHKDITLRNGGWLISICQGSNGDIADMMDNPGKYRPAWFQLPVATG